MAPSFYDLCNKDIYKREPMLGDMYVRENGDVCTITEKTIENGRPMLYLKCPWDEKRQWNCQAGPSLEEYFGELVGPSNNKRHRLLILDREFMGVV